jgi:hypothetical protein
MANVRTQRRTRTNRARVGIRRPAPRTAPDREKIDVAKVLEYFALVAAPTTFASAVLYWFGFELVDARSAYFGLGTGTLDFSTTDYFIRGVEAGIVPVFVLFTAVLAAAGVHTTVSVVATRWAAAPWVAVVAWIAVVCGVAMFVAGMVGLFTPLPYPLDWYLLRPVLLAVGPLAAIEGVRLVGRGAGSGASRTALFAIAGLVVLGGFWAMSIYADALGRGRAIELGAGVGALPAVRVYSERSLALEPAVATGRRLPDADARYRYHYAGLRLLVKSGGKYFLVPDGWTPTAGTVLVLPDTADIRVEFSPGGT